IEIGSSGAGVSGWVEATVVTLPLTPAGLVWPSPVRYTTTVSPFAAGLLGELTLLLLFRMAPGPVPDELSVNNPGWVVATLTWMAFDVWPRNLTRMSAPLNEKDATSYGTTAETWLALA